MLLKHKLNLNCVYKDVLCDTTDGISLLLAIPTIIIIIICLPLFLSKVEVERMQKIAESVYKVLRILLTIFIIVNIMLFGFMYWIMG